MIGSCQKRRTRAHTAIASLVAVVGGLRRASVWTRLLTPKKAAALNKGGAKGFAPLGQRNQHALKEQSCFLLLDLPEHDGSRLSIRLTLCGACRFRRNVYGTDAPMW